MKMTKKRVHKIENSPPTKSLRDYLSTTIFIIIIWTSLKWERKSYFCEKTRR